MKLRITEHLEERGISVAELGRLVGVSRSSMFNTINNSNPTVDTLEKIAKALNVSITDLFESVENNTIGIIRHNNKPYEINSIEDIEKLLEEIRSTKE